MKKNVLFAEPPRSPTSTSVIIRGAGNLSVGMPEKIHFTQHDSLGETDRKAQYHFSAISVRFIT